MHHETIFCIIGYVLLFASIFMNLLKDNDIHKKFMDLLDKKQKIIYKNIINERISIYISGIFLGLFIGFLFLLFYPKTKYRTCKIISIIMITKLIYYYIYPKSTYMLKHLSNQEQVNEWTNIYISMKNLWIKSLILSFISYILIVSNLEYSKQKNYRYLFVNYMGETFKK